MTATHEYTEKQEKVLGDRPHGLREKRQHHSQTVECFETTSVAIYGQYGKKNSSAKTTPNFAFETNRNRSQSKSISIFDYPY